MFLETLENRILLTTPYGATFWNTSDYMLGDIVVNVVLLESDGSKQVQSENWTQTEITNVKNEIAAGAKWWESVYATQRKTGTYAPKFIIDYTYADTPVNVGLEPIKNPYYKQEDWIADAMQQIGVVVTDYPYTNPFTQVTQFNINQRNAYNADWSYTVFVADSSADGDGKFTDGYFAYAYLGGPFMVMTYDNSNWGIGNMDKVFAHETGHIFYALDEYPNSGSYYDKSGYQNIQNTNAYDNNPNKSSRVASIMAEASLQNSAWTKKNSSPASKKMIGWQDTDKDGIMDILDIEHTLTGDGEYKNGIFTFIGNSNVNTLPNQNPKAISSKVPTTLNTIDELHYRIDGGVWEILDLNDSYETSINKQILIGERDFVTIDVLTYTVLSKTKSNVLTYTYGNPVINGNLIISKNQLTTSESGLNDSFSVSLDSAPANNVNILISSSDLTEGTVSGNLVFTPENWNVPQIVNVYGVNDSTVDGNINFSINLVSSSEDIRFNNLSYNLNAINNDNDTASPGISVVVIDRTTTSESGQYSTVSVKLKSQPLSNVIIPVKSSDLSEGVPNVNELIFTPENWNIGQKVITTGMDDNIVDGNIRYYLRFLPAISDDLGYKNKDATDVGLTNYDNDKTASYPDHKLMIHGDYFNDILAYQQSLKKFSVSKVNVFNVVDNLKEVKITIV